MNPNDQWLAEVAAEAAKIPYTEGHINRPVRAFIGSPSGEYGVGQSLGISERFNLYECTLKNGTGGILKIASEAEHNDSLGREAFVLRIMASHGAELEAGHTGEGKLNYANFFPAVIDSFIAESQEGRRINILGFPGAIKSLGQLTPISALTEVERVRVDPRTSAWILGKTLKVLSFAHEQAIANGLVVGSNILIEREMHGVILFDWTQALVSPGYTDRVSQELARSDLSCAGRAVTLALGGNPETGVLPPDGQLVDGRFEGFLHQLTLGAMTDATQAHRKFYELIWALWPRKYHPFTTYPLVEKET